MDYFIISIFSLKENVMFKKIFNDSCIGGPFNDCN